MFEELFSFACPKFLSPVVPNYDNVHPNYHKEPFQQQLKVFAEEVQQQAQLSTIRRYNTPTCDELVPPHLLISPIRPVRNGSQGVYTLSKSWSLSLKLLEALHHHASGQAGRIPGHD